MDSIDGIVLFVKAADMLSFIDVARTTGLSASAVGKSIARLEQSVGVTLFRRTTRSMTLTSEGEIFLQHCRNILGEFNLAKQRLGGSTLEPSGILRITLPLIGPLFNPTLQKFVLKHPKVQLDINFSDDVVDLVEDGFDAAIRIGEIEDSRLVCRHLGSFQMQVVAAPKYLQKKEAPRTLQDLSHHTCLFYKYPSSGKFEEWPLSGWGRTSVSKTSRYTICNSIESILYLVEGGCGIACLPNYLVAKLIEDGLLVTMLEEQGSQARKINIIWPSGIYMTAKLRCFVDFIDKTHGVGEHIS